MEETFIYGSRKSCDDQNVKIKKKKKKESGKPEIKKKKKKKTLSAHMLSNTIYIKTRL